MNRGSLKAHDWNVELEAGHINPSITKRVQWTIQSMWSGTNYKTRRSTLEAEWKNGGGKKAASLAWALNDVFGHMFWIGGAFKVTSFLLSSLVCSSCPGIWRHDSNDGPTLDQGRKSKLLSPIHLISCFTGHHQFCQRPCLCQS